mmetsp:Transcript_1628/g.3656  ORF Transcript_1628/g.3656 Transcript_1628/m.3656 type:complete len:798 (+) Transcript_1628:99-2492(+)
MVVKSTSSTTCSSRWSHHDRHHDRQRTLPLLILLLRQVLLVSYVLVFLLIGATTTVEAVVTGTGTSSSQGGTEKSPFPYVTWSDVQAVKQQRNRQQQIQQPTNVITTDTATNDTTTSATTATATELPTSYRQDVCERWQLVQDGELDLRDALRGLELRPLLRVGPFFHYTDDGGIDPLDPGLLAWMLDELGRRAGFTWRQSFGVVYGLPTDTKPDDVPADETVTFTDLLLWSTETYDLSCNWWDATLERLELGIAFQTPWFDGSIVMVQKQDDPEVDDDSIEIWNWLRPFDVTVWVVTGLTIVFSGLAYQWIEGLSGHRRGRSYWQWFSDNVYLSAIAFPQNYEFRPRSMGGRIFGVSISFWALVMTATYTANLASLLVDTKTTQVVVASIEEAITLDFPVCVYEGTGADAFIRSRYKQAKRIPLPSELETYQQLHDGQCELTLAYYQNWLGFESQKAYNPDCDLEWVGRTVKTIQSGFANSADAGIKCTSLVGSVLNIYFNELLESGFIEELWERHYDKTRDINCDAISPEVLAEASSSKEEQTRQRQRRSLISPEDPVSPTFSAGHHHDRQRRRRRGRRELKAGGRGGASGGAVAAFGSAAVGTEASQMTINQMAGTFILHYWVTAVAILLGYISKYCKYRKKLREEIEGHEEVDVHSKRDMDSRRQSVNPYSILYRQSRGLTKRFSSSIATTQRQNLSSSSSSNGDNSETGDVSSSVIEENGRHDKEPHNTAAKSILVGESSMVENELWEQTQEELSETRMELRETKRELQETRKEMKEQMDTIVSLLGAHTRV